MSNAFVLIFGYWNARFVLSFIQYIIHQYLNYKQNTNTYKTKFVLVFDKEIIDQNQGRKLQQRLYPQI